MRRTHQEAGAGKKSRPRTGPAMKLTTKETVDALTLPAGLADKVYFDDALPGFGLRLRAGGARTWIVQYRLPGERRERRFTLGSPAVFTPAQARSEARKIIAAARLGRDLATEKRAGLYRNLEQRVA